MHEYGTCMWHMASDRQDSHLALQMYIEQSQVEESRFKSLFTCICGLKDGQGKSANSLHNI